MGSKGRDPDEDKWMQTPLVKQQKEPGLPKQIKEKSGKKSGGKKRTRNKGKEVSLGRKKKSESGTFFFDPPRDCSVTCKLVNSRAIEGKGK